MADKSSPTRILAISGSLRRVSSNTALLQAAMGPALPEVAIALYAGLETFSLQP